MFDENKICSVKNRSASRVVYRIPESGIRREFAVGEVKKIPYGELVKLSYQSGGRELMNSFLQIQDIDAIEDLGIHAEPEYNMSEEQIIELMKTGSLDAFLDCLDFAPVGVIDLIKKLSVNLPLTDYDKRQALKEKTGFDIDTALRHIEAEKADDRAAGKIENTGGRRVPVETAAPAEEPAAPARRTAGTNYKVVTTKSE